MSNFELTSFILFLKTLPKEKLSDLFKNQWTCQAIFRSLPALAKQYILRLLFSEDYIESKIFNEWIKEEFRESHNSTTDSLIALNILKKENIFKEAYYYLNKDFQTNLRLAVTGGGVIHASVPENVIEYIPSNEALESFARKQWEELLLFLIGITQSLLTEQHNLQGNELPLTYLFKEAKLTELKNNTSFKITEEGYRFLLDNQNSQLWKLMITYIHEAEKTMGVAMGEVVSFLLELSFRPKSNPGAISALNEIQYNIATHLEQIGLLKTFKTETKDLYYVPTPLALYLCTNIDNMAYLNIQENSIIVETNFKLYGYTMSSLQRAILDLFTHCDIVLPNIYIGTITQESVANAFQKGLNANQIISYLISHRHSKITSNKNIVPENVLDQIKLWEKDINRIECFDSCLFGDFSPNNLVFVKSLEFSKRHNYHLWDDGKSKFAIKSIGYEEVKTYIKNLQYK